MEIVTEGQLGEETHGTRGGEGGTLRGRLLGLPQRTTASLLNINTKTTSKKKRKGKT